MATRIRLRRVGRKRQASFRIVVAGGMHARSGRVTETIGKYNPRTQPSYIEIDEKRALHWLREGAQMSESVEPLFRQAGILRKLADGAEGEGVTVIGDPRGKTLINLRPAAKVVEEAPAETTKPAEKKAKKEKPAQAEAKAEAEAEAKAEPAEAEAAPEEAAEAESGPGKKEEE